MANRTILPDIAIAQCLRCLGTAGPPQHSARNRTEAKNQLTPELTPLGWPAPPEVRILVALELARRSMAEGRGGIIRCGPWPEDCICFPCVPEFRIPEEVPVAAEVTCPLHGARFQEYTSRVIYMDKCTREEMRPYDGAPAEIRSQYEKVWLAAFPLGYLPVEETFVDGQICRRVLSLEEARELQKLSREERWKREYYKGKLK